MTLDGFERHKQALITELLKKNRKIAEEANVIGGKLRPNCVILNVPD